MISFRETYSLWLHEIEPIIAKRDLFSDSSTFIILIFVLYLFETLSHRFVVAAGAGHKILRILLAPGVLTHEIAHYISAVFSGFRNVKLTLLPSDKSPNVLGHVEFSYRPSLLSYIGLIITAIAPLPIGIIVLTGLVNLNGIDTDILLASPSIWYFDSFLNYMEMIILGLLQLPWWQCGVFIYLYVVIAMCMMPSYQDVKTLLVPFMFISCLTGILAYGLLLTNFTIIPFIHYGLMLLIKGLQICLSASFVGLLLVAGGHAILMLGRLIPLIMSSNSRRTMH